MVPTREQATRELGNKEALDALDRLQASLRDRGIDLHRWERELLAQRRAAGIKRLGPRP